MIYVYATEAHLWDTAMRSSGPMLCGDRISVTPWTLVPGRRCCVSIVGMAQGTLGKKKGTT